jgi:hypothetical protein
MIYSAWPPLNNKALAHNQAAMDNPHAALTRDEELTVVLFEI